MADARALLTRSARLVASARADLAKAAAALGIVIAVVGCDFTFRVRDDAEPAPSASSSAQPVVAPVPSVETEDEQQARAIAIKDVALARCEVGGGIPAMGFGFTVICLKPQCVEWTRDPHFPPFKTGLVK
jgi:hypothetical protein